MASTSLMTEVTPSRVGYAEIAAFASGFRTVVTVTHVGRTGTGYMTCIRSTRKRTEIVVATIVAVKDTATMVLCRVGASTNRIGI